MASIVRYVGYCVCGQRVSETSARTRKVCKKCGRTWRSYTVNLQQECQRRLNQIPKE